MLPPLEDLLQYNNPAVIQRYQKDYPDNTLDANEALQQLLRYLWLCQKLQIDKQQTPEEDSLQFRCVVHKEMQQIDDMWHTFLLFTKDYMQFCQHYFGKYLHHEPATDDLPKETDPAKVALELRLNLNYIAKHLGEETLKVWFDELLRDDR